jgi:aerobic-type carbon monoxide dehydrogenase small subunit (CoxS/CutS family)
VGDVGSGEEIVTIEGFGSEGRLSDLQRAFVDHTAFGCGYCTPGMIVTAEALLTRRPQPSRAEIVAAMDDNLCRCGSYPSIVEAIESVAGAGRRGED